MVASLFVAVTSLIKGYYYVAASAMFVGVLSVLIVSLIGGDRAREHDLLDDE